ncbi:hypothetical protein [Streptomyces sp. NPDC086787]|uniref:hypothetical protein n=1 Tax=Streptomyces sp. NPDC086787 TaxID=3365759 RepID=UPI0037FF0628
MFAAVGLCVGATACDHNDDDAWKPPGKGQAAVLLDRGQSDALADLLGYEVKALTTAPDGTVYSMQHGIQRINNDRTVKSVGSEATQGSSGLVVLPDRSLVFGKDHALYKYGSNGQVSVLAGVPGKHRSATAQAPESATAHGFRFADDHVAPLGVRPDGSLIVLDGHVVWSLAKDRLTRVYELPAGDRETRTLAGYPSTAVDRTGTVYITSDPWTHSSEFSHIKDVTAIRTDGTTTPLALPRSVAGVKGSPGDLTVVSLTGDGAEGVYANAYGEEAHYLLHLHAGRAELVARSRNSQQTSKYADQCELKDTVDAEQLPCALPKFMTYGGGKLVLAGDTQYFLQIGIN